MNNLENGVGKKCPALGIQCQLDWCRESGMCKQQKGYTVDDKGRSIPLDEGAFVWCDKHKHYCNKPECRAINACELLVKAIPETAAVKLIGQPKKSMICPCAMPGEPNYCVDPGCLKEGKCLDEAYGAIAVRHGGHTCPADDKPCQLISCDGGNNCYYKRKSGSSVVYHSSALGSPCHEGLYSLGFVNKAELVIGKEIAAKAWDVFEDGKLGLIIGLLGEPFGQGNVVGFNDKAKLMAMDKQLMLNSPVAPNIWIRWPDYGVVPFDRAWWERLLKIIEQVDGPVVIYCMGGHGRSGTCAAILCGLAGLCGEDGDPVQYVRDNYCKCAVESEMQIRYIEEMTGLKVHATGAKTFVYASYGSGVGGAHSVIKPSKSDKVDRKQAQEPVSGLSKKKWKQWWRKQPKTGQYCGIASITRPGDLPDGQTFVIGKTTWKWSAKDGEFAKA